MFVIKKIAVIILSVIILCGVALILWWNIPSKINAEYAGIQYNVDTKTNEQVNIKIDGKLYKNDVFKGKIVIDNFDFTKEYDLIPITFDKSITNGRGTLAYTTVVDGEPILKMIGTIKINDDFSKVYITTNKEETKKDFIIAAPAKNLEEFNEIKKPRKLILTSSVLVLRNDCTFLLPKQALHNSFE